METATPGCTIYFEEAEKDPRPHLSKLYREPIRVRSKVVRAVAVRADMTMSAASNFLLQDQLLAPVAHVDGVKALSSSLDQTPVLVYKDEATVTLQHMDEGTPGYAVFYSSAGESASTMCPKYKHPITVTETGKHRMCFIAMAPMYADSDEVWIDFVVMRQVPPPYIFPPPGRYKQHVTVEFNHDSACKEELRDADAPNENAAPVPAATIFFTINGASPVPTGENETLAPGTHRYEKPLHLTRIAGPAHQADDAFKRYEADPAEPVRLQLRAMSCRPGFIDSLETTSEMEILDQVSHRIRETS